MAASSSIHHQRRWYYVFWAVLLLLSSGALVLWRRPVRIDQATLAFRLQVAGLPAGTREVAWIGPRKVWPGARWRGEGAVPVDLAADGTGYLPPIKVRIARRRWVRDYVPRETWDFLAVRLDPPSGPARYFFYSLEPDIHNGDLRPGYRLTDFAGCKWEKLTTDAGLPDRVP